MKKLLLIITIGFSLTSNAQSYTFSKTVGGTYFNLTGTVAIKTDNWVDFEKGIKLPFPFKYWGANLGDSIYVDDWGSLSISDNYMREIKFLGTDLNSRGTGKTIISYALDGTTPNRIFKIEFRNVGFSLDKPGLKDSTNVQCWLYETSNIIEFRYGPNKVKTSSFKDGGPYVGMFNANNFKYILVEGDPINPTINTTDAANSKPLTGMPLNGTTYKFTPPSGGITQPDVKINIIQNKISLPASLEVRTISIYNTSGQIVQYASRAEEMDLTNLIHGIYFIVIHTSNGVISEKKFL